MDILAAPLLSTLRALAFLTRLPPVRRAFTGRHPLGEDAHAFPLAGLVAGAGPALALVAAGALGLSPAVCALLALALLVAITGALHEDGLGDLADGLGGHHDRTRALAIMKDSRIGAYGALALILSLGLRAALLAELAGAGGASAALALLAAAAGSRGAMAWLWASLPSADPGGLADRVGRPSLVRGRAAALLGLALVAGGGAVSGGLAGALVPALLAALALGQFRRMLIRRLGGQTGDALGAAQQIVEIALLLGFALTVSGG